MTSQSTPNTSNSPSAAKPTDKAQTPPDRALNTTNSAAPKKSATDAAACATKDANACSTNSKTSAA